MNTSVTNEEEPHQVKLPEVYVASPGLISVVIVCMTVMVVCALVYFAVRCYFDERRWRTSASMCKCLPPDSSASLVECGNSCRYVERRAVHAAVQTSSAAEPAPTSNCWAMSDIRTSEARRTGCTFSSPAANNEAVPHWRPPATGSSHRHQTNHYHLPKSSQRQKHRYHRKRGRHYQVEDEEQHSMYPLRRSHQSRPNPSIRVQSPSSSDSYSVLTMSHNSKTAVFNKDLTGIGFSDEDDHLMQQHHQRHSRHYHENQCGMSETGSQKMGRMRYNTPVSEINNNDDLVQVVVDVERGTGNNGLHLEEARQILDRDVHQNDDRKWMVQSHVGGSLNDRVVDGRSMEQGVNSSSGGVGSSHIQLVDGATQICDPAPIGAVDCWYNDLKRRQQPSRTDSSCSLNTVSVSVPIPIRSGLPLKSPFPSCEILPGGRLITRWTQTDATAPSLVSLDWDNYDCERMRTEPELEDDDMVGGGDGFHRLTNVDEGVEGMTTGLSSTTLLMVSHGSGDTTLQASRISNRSASSPYVLCFECSEDFSLTDDRRASVGYFVPRRTSSSPHPRRQQRRPSGPPSPPLSANLPPSPVQSSSHHMVDGQDGRPSNRSLQRRY